MLPSFFPLKMAQRALLIGKSINFIRKCCKDSQWALKGRFALFFDSEASSDFYLRQVAVHNRPLEAAQVRKEHAMLHELLIHDALAAAPSYLRPTLIAEDALSPFQTTDAVRKRVSAIRVDATAKTEELWRALLTPSTSQEELNAMIAAMEPLAVQRRRPFHTSLAAPIPRLPYQFAPAAAPRTHRAI